MNPLILVKISGYFGENKGVILVVIFVKIRGYFNENNQVQLQHSMLWWQSRHVLVQRQRQQKKPGLQQQLPVVGSVAEDSFGSCLPSLQLVLCILLRATDTLLIFTPLSG